MARSRKNPILDLPSIKPAISEPAALPAVTFSPQALQALIDEVTASRQAIADLKAAVTAQAQSQNTKPAKGSPKLSIAGKTEKQIANEILTVKTFKAKGYGNVVPHKDVKTFNLWMQENRRPVEGSKSVTVNNLRLFHISQTRPVTADEKAKAVEQAKAAIDRHNGKAAPKGKPGNVTPLNPQ